eukprot:7386126-Prymnesium_polylepis.1
MQQRGGIQHAPACRATDVCALHVQCHIQRALHQQRLAQSNDYAVGHNRMARQPHGFDAAVNGKVWRIQVVCNCRVEKLGPRARTR